MNIKEYLDNQKLYTSSNNLALYYDEKKQKLIKIVYLITKENYDFLEEVCYKEYDKQKYLLLKKLFNNIK